jgi:gliding motility-associated lipoprotein GldH
LSVSALGWHFDSTKLFEIQVHDTLHPFDFYINLRNNNDYGYSNFYLFLNTRLPNRDFSRDTIELVLADRSGKWLGKGFGRYRDHQILVRENLVFPFRGTYLFEIEQAMRDTLLVGIENVGIRVERVKRD